jgi:tetratricopeptide (TPR) repeat protein
MHFSCASSFRFTAACVALLVTLTSPAGALASPIQEASQYIKQEKFAQAIDVLDKYLAGKPKDAQARFLRGIALTETKKLDAAITVFQKLTEDYPELPEPYNNLAVIYAQQKQYEKAKAALEMAIRTHPAYATAHENLGDIYARLASQAYDKALQLDSSNSSAQSKLSMIQDLVVGVPRSGTSESSKPIQVAQTKPPMAPVSPVVATPVAPIATAPAVISAPVPPTAPVAVATKPASAKPAAAETPKPAVSEKTDADTIAKVVNSWAAAWSRKDVKAYLSHYARDFKTPAQQSRASWEAERRQRIDKPGSIEVSIDRMKVSTTGDKASVSFRQSYKAGALAKFTVKRLSLVNRDGHWQILEEVVGG